MRVYFNTTGTGAGITAPVKNSPLLVRLDKTHFTLSKTAFGGPNIRFTNPGEAEPGSANTRGSRVFDTVDGFSGVWHLSTGTAGKGA